MVIQNSLLLLQEISEIETKIHQVEKVINNLDIQIDIEEILVEILRKSTR